MDLIVIPIMVTTFLVGYQTADNKHKTVLLKELKAERKASEGFTTILASETFPLEEIKEPKPKRVKAKKK